jgi:hypothetical protein
VTYVRPYLLSEHRTGGNKCIKNTELVKTEKQLPNCGVGERCIADVKRKAAIILRTTAAEELLFAKDGNLSIIF